MKHTSRYTGKYSVWTMFRTVVELYDGDDLSEVVAIAKEYSMDDTTYLKYNGKIFEVWQGKVFID